MIVRWFKAFFRHWHHWKPVERNFGEWGVQCKCGIVFMAHLNQPQAKDTAWLSNVKAGNRRKDYIKTGKLGEVRGETIPI